MLANVRAFLTWYGSVRQEYEEAAGSLRDFLEERLSNENIPFAAVTSRAKSLESVRAKILQKNYKRPRRQMMDLLGARVILYRAADIDETVAYLSNQMKVQRKFSTDKRTSLGLREFGYRSYHLIAKQAHSSRLQFPRLVNKRFEIQVRSLLEHAWAEIEHKVVYKSGAELPDDIRRRFASMAGVLELLETDFDSLLESKLRLVDRAVCFLQSKPTNSMALDVPYLLAAMRIYKPKGKDFISLTTPLPPGIELRILLAIKHIGIKTTRALINTLRSPKMRRAFKRYADSEYIPTDQISHLAVLSVVIASKRPRYFTTFFPELAANRALQRATGLIYPNTPPDNLAV